MRIQADLDSQPSDENKTENLSQSVRLTVKTRVRTHGHAEFIFHGCYHFILNNVPPILEVWCFLSCQQKLSFRGNAGTDAFLVLSGELCVTIGWAWTAGTSNGTLAPGLLSARATDCSGYSAVFWRGLYGVGCFSVSHRSLSCIGAIFF